MSFIEREDLELQVLELMQTQTDPAARAALEIVAALIRQNPPPKNRLSGYNLDTDLERGVVPISKAASSLAALIKRSRAQHQPIIVTQKGYPTGALTGIELHTALIGAATISGQ